MELEWQKLACEAYGYELDEEIEEFLLIIVKLIIKVYLMHIQMK